MPGWGLRLFFAGNKLVIADMISGNRVWLEPEPVIFSYEYGWSFGVE
jgi:hypothetical protein